MRWRRRDPPPAVFADLAGTDAVLRAGEPATVVVTLAGDGTAAVAFVYLRRLGWDADHATRWPLADAPTAPGRHALAVDVPTGLAPSCARLSEYRVCADVRVAGARGRTVAVDVAVRAREQDLYTPPHATAAAAPPHASETAALSAVRPAEPAARADTGVRLDAEVVALGGTLSGHVDAAAEVGPTLNTAVGLPGANTSPRFTAVATLEPGPFSVTLPTAAPPTLYDGLETAVVWEVRTAAARRTFGVVDPEGLAVARSDDLLTFLADLAGDGLLGLRR